MKGAYWLIGIVLLIITFLAVRSLFEGTSSANGKDKKDADSEPPPNMIIAWGNFDGEKGVAALDPRQFGDVTYVEAENTKVKKGTLLLQVDDEVTKLKVKAAEQQLTKAKQLTELYKLQAKQQKSAIAAIEIERKTRLKSLESTGSKTQIADAEELFKEKLNAENAKLKQIELQDADLEIAQAETQLKEAKAMLKFFQIIAPDDGTVLRVNVRKGETLGPGAMKHAIEFLPEATTIVKAEVLQEWGSYVKTGQEVIIEDDTYKGPKWKGKVRTISEWYAPTRSPVIEPFRMNDVRTLECFIDDIAPMEGNKTHPRIGQRVRAKIKIDPSVK